MQLALVLAPRFSLLRLMTRTCSTAVMVSPQRGDSNAKLSADNVPDKWPIVPVIAVNKNPVFPKFVKLVEFSNPNMIQIIRRKLELRQPYAGVFLKKDDNNYKEVVENLDEIHQVGTFVHIHEVHDMGDKLRMIVMAHRRIKINKQIYETNISPANVLNNGPRAKTRFFRKNKSKFGKNFAVSSAPIADQPDDQGNLTESNIDSLTEINQTQTDDRTGHQLNESQHDGDHVTDSQHNV